MGVVMSVEAEKAAEVAARVAKIKSLLELLARADVSKEEFVAQLNPHLVVILQDNAWWDNEKREWLFFPECKDILTSETIIDALGSILQSFIERLRASKRGSEAYKAIHTEFQNWIELIANFDSRTVVKIMVAWLNDFCFHHPVENIASSKMLSNIISILERQQLPNDEIFFSNALNPIFHRIICHSALISKSIRHVMHTTLNYIFSRDTALDMHTLDDSGELIGAGKFVMRWIETLLKTLDDSKRAEFLGTFKQFLDRELGEIEDPELIFPFFTKAQRLYNEYVLRDGPKPAAKCEETRKRGRSSVAELSDQKLESAAKLSHTRGTVFDPSRRSHSAAMMKSASLTAFVDEENDHESLASGADSQLSQHAP